MAEAFSLHDCACLKSRLTLLLSARLREQAAGHFCFYTSQSCAPAELIWNYAFPVHASRSPFPCPRILRSRGNSYLRSATRRWRDCPSKVIATIVQRLVRRLPTTMRCVYVHARGAITPVASYFVAAKQQWSRKVSGQEPNWTRQ